MNEEIKEILDNMFHIIMKYEEDFEDLEENEIRYQLPYNKMQKLYDYITNLQQEKPHLHTNTEWEDLLDYKGRTYIELDRFKQVQQENERLKKENNNKAMNDYAHAIDESWYRELYDDYKSRCEKAIEYIKEHQRKDEFLNLNEWQARDLLNILQNGGDKV